MRVILLPQNRAYSQIPAGFFVYFFENTGLIDANWCVIMYAPVICSRRFRGHVSFATQDTNS